MILFYMALETVDNKSQKQRLEEIYNKYSSYVKNIVLKYYPSLFEETEDIVQQVFFLVIKNKECFLKVPEKVVKCMLYDYTKSTSINLLRKRKNKEAIMSGYLKGEVECEDDLQTKAAEREMVDAAKRIINRLPYPESEIIVMKFIYEMKNVEISEVLGLKETNVGTILHRSLKKIRKEMEAIGCGKFYEV